MQSYMEDHLQNTTRLDTEWNALCQYQADGVSYDAAMENIRKNRSSALPCKYCSCNTSQETCHLRKSHNSSMT